MKNKMLQLSLLLTVPFLLWGCVIGCEIEKKISEGLADKIVTVAACKNPKAVQASVLTLVDVVKFCAADKACAEKVEAGLKQGPIANVVCPLAATALVSLVGNTLPKDWQCDPSANQSLVAVVTTACMTLPL